MRSALQPTKNPETSPPTDIIVTEIGYVHRGPSRREARLALRSLTEAMTRVKLVLVCTVPLSHGAVGGVHRPRLLKAPLMYRPLGGPCVVCRPAVTHCQRGRPSQRPRSGDTLEWRQASGQATLRVGVTPLTLFAALGALIERGEDHRLVWDLLGVDWPANDGKIEAVDFSPDALPCLQAVRKAGYTVGLAGNQPAGAEAALGRLGLPVDVIASSARWGVEKPSPAFFDRVSAEVGLRPEQVAYVGDRLDNDVLPAKASGMSAVFIRRGPWGHLHARRAEAACADARIDSLAELTAALRQENCQP